jgi:hypothetical protein
MFKYFFLILFLFSCKKNIDVETNQRVIVVFPSCEEDPLFCDEEFDDLPEHDTSENTGD